MASYDKEKLGFVMVKSLHYLDALSMMVLGIQLFMCIYCLQLYLETPRMERRRRLPYVVFNFVIFVLATTQTFISSEAQFQRTFYSTSGIDVLLSAMRTGSSKLAIAAMFSSCFIVFLSDGLMFYRCYTVRYSDPLWLRLSPAIMYIPSIAFGSLTIAQYARPNEGNAAWPQPTFFCLTVAFNILVTVLIAQRMIQSKTELQAALPGREISLYTGITAIVIESSVPLSATGIGYAVLTAVSISGPGNPFIGQTFLDLFNFLYTSFNQLTPTLIIFRVTTGRSWTTDFHQTMSKSWVPRELEQDMSLRFHHTTQGGEGLESVDVASLEGGQQTQSSQEKEGVTQVA